MKIAEAGRERYHVAWAWLPLVLILVVYGDVRAKAAADNTLSMALLSAVISDTGDVVRGAGVVSSSRSGTGSYQVIFDRDVRECTYAASGGESFDALYRDVIVSADVLSSNSKGVAVAASDAKTGSSADRGFHLVVFCAR